jgi:hypothetical protein
MSATGLVSVSGGIHGQLLASGSSINLRFTGTGGQTTLTHAHTGTGSSFIFTVVYNTP